MKKAGLALVLMLVALPTYAIADTQYPDKRVELYQRLVTVLQEQLVFLQNNPLSISATSGPAPLSVTFTLNVRTETEAIDFGDGHSTGSGGCKTNPTGNCDLSGPITHIYQLPGTYTVTLYRSTDPANPAVITKHTIDVIK